MRLRQPERALSELEKAAPIDFHGDLHYLLYVAYRNLGRKDLGWQKAENIQPRNFSARYPGWAQSGLRY
jgi:hypothetical protein